MPSFTATTHEADTIARAGIGGTVAIVRRLKVPSGVHTLSLIATDGRWEVCEEVPGYTPFFWCKPPLSPGKPVWVKEGWGVGCYPCPHNGWNDVVEYSAGGARSI